MDFAVIEFPGVVKNSEAALDMLGGIKAVSSTMQSGSQLELRFQPNNPYLAGLVADKQNMSQLSSGQLNLVLRVRRKKNDPGAKCIVECLGTVSTRFYFRTIADFQYLPVERTNPHINDNIYEDLLPKLVPTDFTSALSWWETNNNGAASTDMPTYFLPPFLFSRYNAGSTRILGPDVERQPTTAQSAMNPSGHARNLRTQRKALTVTVNSCDPFPEGPSEAAIKEVDSRFKNENVHKKLSELFDERPMWTRPAIITRTELDSHTLKVLLAKYAFYIASGPWGRLWCRFGYEPREDPNARKYQTVIPEKRRLKAGGTGEKVSTSATVNSTNAEAGDEDYMYKTGQLPSVRQMWYCICDIHLPEAQKILESKYSGVLPRCDEVQGWLPADTIASIRSAIRVDVEKSSRRLEAGGFAADESISGSEESEGESGHESEDSEESLEDFEIIEDDYNDAGEMLAMVEEADMSEPPLEDLVLYADNGREAH